MKSWASLSVALVCVACGPKMTEVNRQHATAVNAKLTQAEAVKNDAAKAPLLEKDEVPTRTDLVLALKSNPTARSNALVAYSEDLERPGELGPVYARLEGARFLPDCA